VALYIDETNRLTLDIYDSEGIRHLLRATAQNLWSYDEPLIICAELGISDNYSYPVIKLNGEYACDSRIHPITIKLPISEQNAVFVLGSDISGQEKSHFDQEAILIFNRTLSFVDAENTLLHLRSYQSNATVQFHDNKFMYSMNHPRLARRPMPGATLIQEEPSRRPTYRQFVSNTPVTARELAASVPTPDDDQERLSLRLELSMETRQRVKDTVGDRGALPVNGYRIKLSSRFEQQFRPLTIRRQHAQHAIDRTRAKVTATHPCSTPRSDT
jgi:hypothetical protein